MLYKFVLSIFCLTFAISVSAQENNSNAPAAVETAAAPSPKEGSATVSMPKADQNSDLEKQMTEANHNSIEILKKQNFDFNTKDTAGNPALYYLLTRNPDLEVAKKAIEYGADVNMPAANGMIPLNIATSKANELQLQIMMMKTMGLDVSNPEIQDKLKENLFREMNRMSALTQMLIDAGADINQTSPLGTPLMNAATNAWNAEIIQLLINAGADVNKTDKDGKTALFYAASSGNDDIVSQLIKAGADPDIKDNNGKLYFDIERIDVGNVL